MSDQSSGRNSPYFVEITIPPNLQHLGMVRSLVRSAVEGAADFGEEKTADLLLVATEATANAIAATKANGLGKVRIRCDIDQNSVRLKVADEGSGIPDSAVAFELPEVTLQTEEGSLGIPLMRHLADSWKFVNTDHGAVVEMELRQTG